MEHASISVHFKHLDVVRIRQYQGGEPSAGRVIGIP
eukprot:CAMPEP_0115331968 /NCGR_PEP_ID=MMETSP0270-20121206/86596_1 /TAXON_ID=71861 /ORGANISM="Scrippsiella trochoidea, Strain CCMP3099" /LENGTH=35 /DNA_ID= /DNA_START= /DNA_END= /DNA_ORIENTATION=